jgi:hypothetical protein
MVIYESHSSGCGAKCMLGAHIVPTQKYNIKLAADGWQIMRAAVAACERARKLQ